MSYNFYRGYVTMDDVDISSFKMPIMVKHLMHDGKVVENQITNITFGMLEYNVVNKVGDNFFHSYVDYIHLSDVIEESLQFLLQLGIIEKECLKCNNLHHVSCPECSNIEDEQYCCTYCWGSKKVDCLDCKSLAMSF